MKKNTLYFLPLGGSGEIGMNMNLYAYQDKWLIVDCGVTFGHDLGVEVIMPDPEFIVSRSKNLVGLVATHAHEDHIGAIAYLYNQLKCPVYATPFTMGLIKRKLQDIDQLNHAILHEIPLNGRFQLDLFDLQFMTLTHSIPEPNALVIRTPAGTVFHTGDWKIDAQPLMGQKADVDALKNLGDQGVMALICDSTNAMLPGRAGSEVQVRQALSQLVKEQKKRVAISCFASNLVRVHSAILAAQENNRRVALVGRSLTRIVAIAQETGYLNDIPEMISAEQAMALPESQVMLICTGSQGEPRAALSRIAAKDHPHVWLSPEDAVIFSSRVIPGNEESIHQLQIKLNGRGINVVTDADAPIHVSGHPNQDDLKDMYAWIRPHALIPVHGEYRHMSAQEKLAQENGIHATYVPQNGQLIQLDKKEAPSCVETVRCGYLALDGQHLVSLSSKHLKERSLLKNMGAVFVTLVTGHHGALLSQPQITYMGLSTAMHALCTKSVKQSIENALQTLLEKSDTLEVKKIQSAVRRSLYRTLNEVSGKKPMVGVHVILIKGKK